MAEDFGQHDLLSVSKENQNKSSFRDVSTMFCGCGGWHFTKPPDVQLSKPHFTVLLGVRSEPQERDARTDRIYSYTALAVQFLKRVSKAVREVRCIQVRYFLSLFLAGSTRASYIRVLSLPLATPTAK